MQCLFIFKQGHAGLAVWLVLYMYDLRQAIVRSEISRDLYKAFKHCHLLLNCLFITRRVSGHVYTCFL